MNELTQAVAATMVEVDSDLAAGFGFHDGWTAWTLCPNDDGDGYHLHKQGQEPFYEEPIHIYVDEWTKYPLPLPLIGVIIAYAIERNEDAGVFVGRVMVGALRDGTLLVLTRINDQKPKLQIAGPQRGVDGAGMAIPNALRTHVTNPVTPNPYSGLRGLLQALAGHAPGVIVIDPRMFEPGEGEQL